MQKIQRRLLTLFLIGAALLLFSFGQVKADGTETLGPPTIPIATGSSIIAAGTGLADGTGVIDLIIPADATVKQVLLYWEGQMLTDVAGDNTARLNGSTVVTGALIGGPAFFSGMPIARPFAPTLPILT